MTIDSTEKLARFEAWKRTRADEKVLGGEPTFRGSRLGVRNVGGMLLRGAPPEEIREDYPYLVDEDIEFAPLFTGPTRLEDPQGQASL